MVKYQHMIGFIYLPLFKFALYIMAPLYVTFNPRSKHMLKELLLMGLYYMWIIYLISFLPSWEMRIAYFMSQNLVVSIVFLQIVLAHLAMPTEPFTEHEEFFIH